MIKIVQCWDDGVEDDIRLCELLREKQAKASFNLNPGLHGPHRGFRHRYKDCKDVLLLAKPELRAVYDGFTIANHSVSHPWATRIPLADWQREVEDGRKQLQDIFSQPVWGFAYPYGDTNGATTGVVRDAGHIYARSCGNATPCYPPANPMQFAPDCHHAAPDFWERYARAKAVNAGVFYFWGHSYEFVTEQDWQFFASKLDRFNADPEAVWVNLPELFLGETAL
jgi:peptidoglycan/xylan/chitin deacetylase (PgdA/CDA1 family)